MNELPTRFRAKISVNGDCWLWQGSKNDKGYGTLGIRGKHWKAHRFAYATLVGEIPLGKELDHLCRNRSCVNPEHLEPVDHRENVVRGKTSRLSSPKTHCRRGHEYTKENTHVRTKPRKGRGRECRTCMRDRERLRLARAKVNFGNSGLLEMKFEGQTGRIYE